MGKAVIVIGMLSFAYGVLVGVMVVADIERHDLKACARQHNVYACHMVAVPSEKEEER